MHHRQASEATAPDDLRNFQASESEGEANRRLEALNDSPCVTCKGVL